MKPKIMSIDYEDGTLGYDISVDENGVTVQDYLNALNAALMTLDLSRSREDRKSCRGCDLCCGERIPLTIIDLLVLAESPAVRGTLGGSLSGEHKVLAEMLRRFSHVYVDGRSVDITLRLGEDNKCIFLERETKTCSVYDFRPFVCQTFICCPASKDALELREAVVNAGEDELVRRWLEFAEAGLCGFWYDEADSPDVDLEDWVKGPFTGKSSYSQVLIKDVLPPGLWARLHQAS
jgi:Fe-S-cluster containining protein